MMISNIGSFLTSNEVLRIFFIAGAIFGVATLAYVVARQRSRSNLFSMFIYWFCYLNLFSKYTYLFY